MATKLGEGLFKGIGKGLITKKACELMLEAYRRDRTTLQRTKAKYGLDLYNSKMNDINMSIDLMKIIIQRYEQIAKEFGRHSDNNNVA